MILTPAYDHQGLKLAESIAFWHNPWIRFTSKTSSDKYLFVIYPMRMVPKPLISSFNLSKPPSYLDPGFSSTPCVPICICFDLPLGHSYWPHLHNGLCQPRTWSVALEGWMLDQKIAMRVIGSSIRAEEAKSWSQSWYSVYWA